MSQTLIIPDDLYARLDDMARRRGMSIEELLRAWQATDQNVERSSVTDAELRARHDALARSEALYEELAARYGMFPDSTDLIREDRAR